MSDTIRRQDAIDAIVESGRTIDSRYLESERIVSESDAIEALLMLPPAQQLIPCSEWLPKKDGHYIVYAPTYSGGSSSSKEHHDGVMFSAFKKGKWSIEHGYHKRPNCVVAWMPLPELYKEVEE